MLFFQPAIDKSLSLLFNWNEQIVGFGMNCIGHRSQLMRRDVTCVKKNKRKERGEKERPLASSLECSTVQ
ncbi:uncharacterized protein DS421_11g326490 [Arachis hypogaea]|nr:uncharacterized protein DS421_11g326490 [Arachis hypogaea]